MQQLLLAVSWPLLLLMAAFCFSPLIPSAASAPQPKIHAFNNGGWLVIQGWMTPSSPWLLNEMPNNEFLDGGQLQFKSVTTGKYLAAESGGGSTVVANRPSVSRWETFEVWNVNENSFRFRVFDGQFWGLGGVGGTSVVAYATTAEKWETFQIVRHPNDSNRVRIQAPNGLYLRANSETSVTAEARGASSWGDGDRSVFVMTLVGSSIRGLYQLTSGYRPQPAASMLRLHAGTSNFSEGDLRCPRYEDLNAVRMPVRWWMAHNPVPRACVSGRFLQALDNAFNWADKYGLGVIIDLEPAPAGQNHDGHGGSRDGTVEWDSSDQSIHEAVQSIYCFPSRYANRQRHQVIVTLSGAQAAEAPLDALLRYYSSVLPSTAVLVILAVAAMLFPLALLRFYGSANQSGLVPGVRDGVRLRLGNRLLFLLACVLVSWAMRLNPGPPTAAAADVSSLISRMMSSQRP